MAKIAKTAAKERIDFLKKELERRNYNYFESMDLGPGPFTFRLTDIYGNAVVDRDIPLIEPDIDQDGHVQFPAG